MTAKAKAKAKTLSERMRSAKRSQADAWLEELADDLSVWKAAAEQVAQALDGLGQFDDGLEQLPDALEQLPGTSGLADAVRDTVVGLRMLLLDVGPAEAFTDFVEAYDGAENALADYVDLRDGDSYPGIADERREAWDEAAEALGQLADQVEEMENVDEPATASHVDEDDE